MASSAGTPEETIIATIIDALLVTLSLDPAAFKAGSKEVDKGLKDTEKNADRTAKDLQAHGKKAAEFFGQIRNQVIALATTFTAGAGLKAFAEHLTNADAAAGRTARNIGITTEALSTWQGVAERAGGSAEGITGSMQGLSQQFQQLYLTGQSSIVPFFRAVGVGLVDASGKMRPMGDILLDLSDKFSKMDPARAQALGKGMGLDEGTINVLMQGRAAITALLAEQHKLNVLSKEDADAAAKRQSAFRALGQASEQLGRALLTRLTPAIEMLASWLTRLGQWFQEHPAAFTAFAATLGAVAVAVTASLTLMSIKGFLGLVASLVKVPAAATAATTAMEGAAVAGSKGLLTMLTGLASSAALLAAAGAVGYAIGSLIWKAVEGTKIGDKIGEFVTVTMAAFGDKDAQAAIETELNAKAGLGPQPTGRGKAAAPKTASNAPATPLAKGQAEGDIKRFVEMGWTREQAAGIVANIQAESSGNERAVGDNGSAYGLAQWHPDRQREFMRKFGKDIRQATRDEQLQFINFELREGKEAAAGRALSQATTAQQAAQVIVNQYERPADRAGESTKRSNIAAMLAPGPKVDRAMLANAGAATAVAQNTTNNHATTNTSSAETHIQNLNVNLPQTATDAEGISKGIMPAMQRNFALNAQANFSLG